MFRAIAALCATGTLLVAAASPAAAQCTATGSPANCTQTGSVSMAVDKVIRVAMGSASTTITPPTLATFTAGFGASNGPTVTVSSNSNWTLSVRAASALWGATGLSARTNKPAADLKWSTSVNGPFVSLTTSNNSITTGVRTAAAATTLFYHTTWSSALDTPGAYTMGVVFTLTSQ